MGCHTWFYVRMEPQPTYEECKQSMLNGCDKLLKHYEHIKRGLANVEKLTKNDMYLIKTYKITPASIKADIKNLKNKISEIERDKCPELVKKEYCDNSWTFDDGLIKYYNGVFYQNKHIAVPHNIFRVSDYPDDILTSYEDFEHFYDNHTCYPPDDDDVRLKMMNFWENYPDSIVMFG